MRVRNGLYRSPHFSNDQSTPHSAALHTGLRSGHTSGVQDVNLFPSWMTLRLTARWRRARCGSREPFFHDRHEMESGWPNVFSESPKRCWSMGGIDINNIKN